MRRENKYLKKFIKDNRGQWVYPGENTLITGDKNGTDITMNGVNNPLLAISNKNEKMVLYPGMNVHFDGNEVYEIPLKSQIGIHINPKNKGKFTEAANRAGKSVQAYAAHILANKENYSPMLIKRANFARNSAKFKHQEGGNQEKNIFDDFINPIDNIHYIPKIINPIDNTYVEPIPLIEKDYIDNNEFKYYPSDSYIEKLKEYEGFNPNRYWDNIGNKWTIGYGFTAPDLIKKGSITQEEGDYYLKREIDKRIQNFLKSTPNYKYLNQNQLDALFDIYWNVGEYSYTTKSPKLQKSLKDLNFDEIVRQMNHGENQAEGLKKRRSYNRTLFKTPINNENFNNSTRENENVKRIYIGEAQNGGVLNKYLEGSYVQPIVIQDVMNDYNIAMAKALSKGDRGADIFGTVVSPAASMATEGGILLKQYIEEKGQQGGNNAVVMENNELLNQDGLIFKVLGKKHESASDNIMNNGKIDGVKIQLGNNALQTLKLNPNLVLRTPKRRINKYISQMDKNEFVVPSTVNEYGYNERKTRNGKFPQAIMENKYL